jgi:hypothetical protein
MLQNITVYAPAAGIPLSLVSRDVNSGPAIRRQVKESSFTECSMMFNVSHPGG